RRGRALRILPLLRLVLSEWLPIRRAVPVHPAMGRTGPRDVLETPGLLLHARRTVGVRRLAPPEARSHAQRAAGAHQCLILMTDEDRSRRGRRAPDCDDRA